MSLLPHLPAARVRAAFDAAGGNEFASGKFDSPASSAALAANALGLFLDPDQAASAPDLAPSPWAWGGPPREVMLEFQARFPWSGGRHPWLDAAVITDTHLVGIESKRYEPFRGRPSPAFPDAFDRAEAWGEDMEAWTGLRDALRADPRLFERLDAAQMTKHALGLKAEAARRGLRPALVHRHALPRRWPAGPEGPGGPIPQAARDTLSREASALADRVAGSAVPVRAISYAKLLAMFGSGAPGLRAHAAALREAFPDI